MACWIILPLPPAFRMAHPLELDISFTESTAPPVGLGKPGPASIAPAIAGAIFSDTNARLNAWLSRFAVAQVIRFNRRYCLRYRPERR